MKRSKLMILLFISISLMNQSFAKDFGRAGMVFTVVEEGFLRTIQRKLALVNIEEEQRKMTDLAKERVNNPLPLDSLRKAEVYREFYHDPSYTLQEDVLLPNGEVLHKAGTKVNPLDHMNLERRLIFIDGRDKEQVVWLKKMLEIEDISTDAYEAESGDTRRAESTDTKESESAKGAIKDRKEIIKINRSEEKAAPQVQNRIILTGGRIFDLQEEIGKQLYFDQAGELTSKFGIKAVPAIVEQEGRSLKIREVEID